MYAEFRSRPHFVHMRANRRRSRNIKTNVYKTVEFLESPLPDDISCRGDGDAHDSMSNRALKFGPSTLESVDS